MTTRAGSKMERLSWPGKSVVRRSFFVSIVMMTSLRASPLLFTNQIAPVIDAATFTDFTLFQRSSPPCAFTARSNKLLIKTPRALVVRWNHRRQLYRDRRGSMSIRLWPMRVLCDFAQLREYRSYRRVVRTP